MDDYIPLRPDRSLLFGRQTSKWSSWDLVFHENYSICIVNHPLVLFYKDRIFVMKSHLTF